MLRKRQQGQGFSRRLSATIVLTVLLIGAAQYFLASRELTARVLQQSVQGFEGDAQVLHGLYQGPDSDLGPVAELLGHIAARPGVRSVVLLDADGEVLLEGVAHGADMADHGDATEVPVEHTAPAQPNEEMAADNDMAADGGMAAVDDMAAGGGAAADDAQPAGGSAGMHGSLLVDAVLRSGTSYAGTQLDPAGEMLIFAVEVDLAGRPAVMVVERDATELQHQVSSVAWVLLVTLVLGSVGAVPLFHVLGGRALRQSHDRALRDSTRDALTGLGNHRAFHEELRREVEIARRHGHPLTLISLDLDGFKQVNDRLGHRHGDAILEEIGAILRSGRTEDRPFRTGGDEFCVLLVSTTAADAERVAEHLRRRIDGEVDGVTASVGIAELGIGAPDVESLLHEADKAMYASKHGGRNLVTVAAEGLAFPADDVERS
ncbi:MAG TPA: GGDEF domain-containing protein [Euzebya sp.]|nr:GGDEF domain-containing protein [Euzebya sp.]